MAKGFTVKTAAPVKKKKAENGFSIDKARELIKGKTIVFCLPGRGVSYIFLKAFVGLCFDLVQNGTETPLKITKELSQEQNNKNTR